MLAAVFLFVCLQALPAHGQYLRSPQPGDVYKEFTQTMRAVNSWRVTDPDAPFVSNDPTSTNIPSAYLPNPLLSLNVNDLNGAVRAEAVIDLWGGHVGTTGKKMRFNGNNWLTIPELATTPRAGQCYTHQTIYVVDVPLSHLVQGNNTFEGTSGGQTCFNFNWGQWGWYSLMLRVYYDDSKPHPVVNITSPAPGATITDNPSVSATSTGGVGIQQVQFLAYYDGYDSDGDGRYRDYHQHYHRLASENYMPLRNHVGTSYGAPHTVVWNTSQVPDQTPGEIKLIARVRGTNGVWAVTDEVTGLTLARGGTSVKLYKPHNVPQKFWVRGGEVQSSRVTIPNDHDLLEATEAWMLIRTWNGIDGEREPGQDNFRRINDWDVPEFGRDHVFSYDVVPIDVTALRNGTNMITLGSNSSHHGIEILWPGPAILVRYDGAAPPPDPPTALTATATAEGVDLAWTPPATGAVAFNVSRNDLVVATGLVNPTYLDTTAAEFTTYSFVVTAVGPAGQESDPSTPTQVMTLQDFVPPTLRGVVPLSTTVLQLEFSEPVTVASGGNLGNYAIEGGPSPVSVTAANVAADGTTVTLTMSPIVGGAQYICTVDNIQDRSVVGNLGSDARLFRIEPGLVHHFPFDMGSGAVARNYGTVGGDAAIDGAQWSTTTATGSGQSLRFTGDDAVRLGNLDLPGDQLTIAMWIRADQLSLFDARLISKATGTAGNDHYWMVSMFGSELRFRLKTTNGDTSTLISSGAGITTNNWVHVTAVYDGQQMLLYRNGAIIGQVAKSGAVATNVGVPASIGNQPQGGKTFSGRLDDIRIYDRALTTAQVGELFNPSDNTPPLAPPGLTAVAAGPTLVDLAWGPTGDASGLSYYRLLRNGVEIATSLRREYRDATVAHSTTYSYQVVAVDGAGNASAPSVGATVVTPEPDTTPPSVPQGLTTDEGVLGGAALLWSASTDNVAVAQYLVLRDGNEVGATPGTAYVDTGLTPGVEYSYQIIAVDTSGNPSAPSAPLALTLGFVAEGLVAAYGFDEAGGTTVTDLSGAGFNGTLAPPATRNGIARYGQSLLLPGTGGHVDLHAIDVTGSALTLAVWARFDDFGVFDARLISKASGVNEQDHFWMLSTYGKRVRFRLKTDQGGTATLISPTTTLASGVWTHLAATYDGTQMRLWQDGVVIASAPKTGALLAAPSVAAWIADNPGGGRNIDGRLDDVRIYSIALNADQMMAAMTTELPEPTTGPPPPPPPPPAAPDAPTALSSSGSTPETVSLTWAAVENATQYAILRDGAEVALATTASFIDSGLTVLTEYDYTVVAIGATGLRSDPSAPITVRTTSIVPERALFAAGMAPFGIADTNTGAFAPVAVDAPDILGLARDHDNDVLFASLLLADGSGALAVVDPSTGTRVQVGATTDGSNRQISGLAFDSTANVLYGLGVVGDRARLYSVDQNSGVVTNRGEDPQVLAHDGLGLAYDDENDVLYGLRTLLSGAIQVTTIDRATGNHQVVSTLPSVAVAEALTYCREQRTLFTIDLVGPTLIAIDPVTGLDTAVGATSSDELWGAACKEPVPDPLPVDPPPVPDPTPTPHLLMFYDFEGAGSVATDLSGNSNDGLLRPGVSREATIHDNGIRFNGAAHVDLQRLDIPGDQLTIALWCRPDDFGVWDARLISKSTGTADQDHNWMVSQLGRRLRFRLKTTVGGTATLIAPNLTLTAGVWQHVAVTYDGTQMRIYQDGALLAAAPKTGAIVEAPAVEAYLGDNPTSGKGFDGKMDDVCIFTRALDAAELTDLAANGIVAPTDPGGGGTTDPVDMVAPSTPVGVVAMAVSPTRVEISWDAATDDVSTTVTYLVIRSGAAPQEELTTTFIETDLTPQTQYVYRVSAVDEAGNASPASAPVIVETLALGLPVALYGAGDVIPAGVIDRTTGAFQSLGGGAIEVLGLAGRASDTTVLASAFVAGQPVLGNLDLTTGSLTVIAPTTSGGVPTPLDGLAIDPNSGTLFGMTIYAGGLADLFAVDTSSGQLAAIGSFPGVSMVDGCGLAYDWMLDTLYALRTTTAGSLELVVVDTTTGTHTLVGAPTGIGSADGLAYCGDTDMLYTVDRTTGSLVALDSMTAQSMPLGGSQAALAGLACAAPVAVQDSSLILAFGFEGTGGDADDASGNDNSGSIVGATRTSGGHTGAGLQFDGSDDRLEIGNLDISGDELTIAMWFRVDDFGVYDARLISKATGTAEQDHWWMVSTLGNRLRFRLKTSVGGTSTLIAPSGSLPTATWVHVAVTYNGAQMTIYQNGVAVASRAKQGSLATAPGVPAWIGDNPGGGRAFDGRMDDVRILDRALEAGEVLELLTQPVE
ncbi:MAG: LamG-like jellyroll fold domain-containing protein [Planctomycetota bacterium]